MPSSPPSWIRETGIVLVWGAAAGNVFIYTAKAFRATYSDMSITSDPFNAPGVKTVNKTEAQQVTGAVQGKGQVDRKSPVAKAIAGPVNALGSLFGKPNAGVALANAQAASGGAEFGTTQASQSIATKILNWLTGN